MSEMNGTNANATDEWPHTHSTPAPQSLESRRRNACRSGTRWSCADLHCHSRGRLVHGARSVHVVRATCIRHQKRRSLAGRGE